MMSRSLASGRWWAYAGAGLGGALSVAANIAHAKLRPDPETFEVSESTAEAASFGSASLWNGKSSALSWAFGPLSWKALPAGMRGLIWLRDRLSAPASKWHVAHAWRPSAPACMSQNSALPSVMALALSLM